jgi:hypothetical protein
MTATSAEPAGGRAGVALGDGPVADLAVRWWPSGARVAGLGVVAGGATDAMP